MSRALRSEFHDADHSPGLLLWQVTNTWQAAQRAALRPFDLTHVQSSSCSPRSPGTRTTSRSPSGILPRTPGPTR